MMLDLIALLATLDCTVDGTLAGTYDVGAGTWSAVSSEGETVTGTLGANDIRGEPAVGYRWGGYGPGQIAASYHGGYVLGEWHRTAGQRGTVQAVYGTCPSRDPEIFEAWYGGPLRVSSTVVALAGQSNAVGRNFGPGTTPVQGALWVSGEPRTVYLDRVSVERLADDPAISVLKRAVNGSSIQTWALAGSYGDQLIDDATAAGVVPSAVVWMQGESADGGARVSPADYGARVGGLFDRWETAWGPQLFLDMPIAEITTVRAEINQIKRDEAAARGDVVILDVSGLPYQDGGVHLTRAGLDELSLRIRDELDHTRAAWTP